MNSSVMKRRMSGFSLPWILCRSWVAGLTVMVMCIGSATAHAQQTPEESNKVGQSDPKKKEDPTPPGSRRTRRLPPNKKRATPSNRPTQAKESEQANNDDDPRTRNPRSRGNARPSNRGPARNPRNVPAKSAPEETETPSFDIAPIDADIPPEEKQYSFSCVDCTYTQLVEGFARQTGLGVQGDAPKDGKIKFVTTEVLDFKEALARIRMILFNYKPHEPYWIEREGTHLQVLRVNDLTRILDVDRWFRSLDELWAANLSDDDLAMVIHTPKSGSIAAIRQVRDFLPDYVRWTPMEDKNAVTIFAQVKDIRKYVDLIEIFRGGTKDPRVIERIKIENLLPSEVVQQLQLLMAEESSGSSSPSPRARSSARGKSSRSEPNPLETVKAPGVTYIPFDDQQVLLVQAMPGKIEEIKSFLPYIDVENEDPESGIVVVPVEHADPADLAETIRVVISAMDDPSDTSATTSKKKSSRRARSAAVTPEAVSTGAITLMVHPSESALIVIADEEGVQKVRELVERFDMPSSIGPIPIAVTNVSATQMIPRITEVLGTAAGSKAPTTDFQLLANPTDDALWFTGSKRDLEKVREIAAMLDVTGVAPSLHIMMLKRQSPSFVANILRELDQGDEGGGKARAGAKRVSKTVAVSKFTANDEQNRLYIFCTDAEWIEYLAVIKQLEDEIGDQPPFVRLAVENIDPDTAVEQLTALQSADVKVSGARLAATEGAVLVIGATERVVEEFKAILQEIDREGVAIEQRTFEIRYGDPDAIKTAIETLVGGDTSTKKKPARRSKRKGGGAASGSVLPEVTILRFENRLVVQATPETMTEVAAVIAEFDVDQAASVMKVYTDFPRGSDIDAMADTLVGMLAEPGAPRPKSQGAVKTVSADGGPTFVPQTDAGRLVVIAKPDEYPKIEEYLNVLRVAVSEPVTVTEFVELMHAQPETIIDMVAPLLEIRAEMMVADGLLQPKTEPSGKRAKRTTRKTGSATETSNYFHLQPDLQQSRVIVAAPQVLVDAARELITEFDRPSPDDAVFKTVALANSSAADMVRSITGMMGKPARPARRSKDAAAPAETFDASTLNVVEAPGGGAIILHGPAKAVEEASAYIEHLDGMSGGGREIKVFQINTADVFDLGELIVNVVDTPAKGTGVKPRRARLPAVDEDEFDDFETTKTWTAQDLYMKGDKISYTLLVATTPQKLAEIEGIINDFDSEDSQITPPSIPKFYYELEHRDAMEAALDLDMLLQADWDGSETPNVDYFPFGNTLVIRYPQEDKFEEIRRLIRDHIDKPGEGPKIRKKGIPALKGTSARETALMLKMAFPDIDFNIVDRTPKKDLTSGVEQLTPRSRGPNPCAMPLGFERMATKLAVLVIEQTEKETKSEPDPLQSAVSSLLNKNEPSTPERKNDDEEEKLNVYIDDSTGELIFEGREDLIDELPTMIEELKEETKDLQPKPDIRIYRVRYIDVFTATEILGEMFNATRQQVQAAQRQQRAAQQAARQAARRQQQQQQRQQQNQARGGQQPQAPQRGQQPGQQATTGQLPPESVRIYPNPRDRSLILRAEASQYPAILELLATIDQPQPINSEMKVFRLEKLNASDVEALLNDMLGLGASASRGRRSSGGDANTANARRGSRSTSRTSSDGNYLPQTIMQEMVSGVGTGALGVDAKDIKLSSNEESNTIIVMAPPAAIEFVGTIIGQLESEDIPEREPRYYDLKHATASNVVEQLEAHYGSGGSGSKRGGDSGDLNTPAFVAYPRLNMLTAIGTAEQHVEIDEIVARLDVAGDENDWQFIALDHADAKLVADTLSKMFGGDASSGSSKGRGLVEAGPQFIGDDGGRTLLFSAAEHLHISIKDAIAKLETDAAETMKLHVITLQHAKPSDMADAIESAYGGSTKRGAGKSSGGSQFSLTPHDASNRLFVRADESFFQEIQSLATSLDQPKSVEFEFRVYPLQFADAVEVHETMSKLMSDYLKLLSPEARGNMDAFSVDVNERANALVVLGNDLVFTFLEENLAKIDNPAAKMAKPGVMMMALKTADAREVAANITSLWAQKNPKSKELPPVVQANPSLNMLIVRGTQEQLDEIKNDFVDPLELESPLSLKTETIALQFADPDAVADSINRLFEDKKRAVQGAGTGQGQAPLTFTVVVTPVASTRQVIVQASDENMAFVKSRIAELDTEEIAGRIATRMKIYTIGYADPANVAKIINEWSKSKQQSSGSKQGAGAEDLVNAVPEPATRSVVVTATETNHMIVKELIDGLDDEKVAAIGEVVRVVPIQFGNAAEMQTAITEYLRKPAGSGGKGELVGDMRLSVLAESNALVISGSQEEVDRIEKTIQQLDMSGEESGTPQIIRLTHAQAGEIAPSLQEMFTGKAKSRGTPPVILANEAANTLIVRADRQDLTAIRNLVAELDTEEESMPNFRLVSVAQGVNVTDLAEKVEQTINESASMRPGSGNRSRPLAIRATPDTRSRSIILAGSPSLFNESEELIRAMEKLGPPGGRTMGVITLTRTPVEDIERLIEGLKGDSGGSGSSRKSSTRRSSPSRNTNKRSK